MPIGYGGIPSGRLPSALPVPVAEGGTASATAGAARTALGLAIGTDVGSEADTATALAHVTADGTSHANVALNDTHRSSDGSDHTYIDQDVTAGAGPDFDVSNMSGGRGADLSPRWADSAEIVAVSSTHGLADVADLLSSPDTGWAWDHDANMDSASIGSSMMTLVHDNSTADRWENGNYTCPIYTTSIARHPSAPIVYMGHCKIDDATVPASYEGGGAIFDAGENNRYLWIGLHQHGAQNTDNFRLKAVQGGGTEIGSAVTGVTKVQAAAGWYFAIVSYPDGDIAAYYKLAAYTGPLAWKNLTAFGRTANHFQPADLTLDVGVYNMAHTAANGTSVSFQWLNIIRPKTV